MKEVFIKAKGNCNVGFHFGNTFSSVTKYVYKATLKTSTDSEVYADSSPPKAMRLTHCS